MATVVVDFDGVIHKYSKGWQDGSIYDVPIEGAKDGMHELLASWSVVVCTSRTNLREVADYLRDWLGLRVLVDHPDSPQLFWNERNIVYVTNRKLPAEHYIDDRAVPFVSWPIVFEKREGE